MSLEITDEVEPFDFEKHERDNVAAYLERQGFYISLANVFGTIVKECITSRDLTVHSVQSRAKEPSSFGKKASIPSETDVNCPKYDRPFDQITDLAGVRVITQLYGTLSEVDRLITEEFIIIEKSDKSKTLIDDDRFGYQSIHFLVKLKHERSLLAEYRRFANSIVEIQLRTILQHAWAEIEHDIQYKSTYTIPKEIRRRFMALAGMLELADREFQAIQNSDKLISDTAAAMVRKGDLGGVEITAAALKLFLDNRLGADRRTSQWSYEWAAKQLRQLGFTDLNQVKVAITGYDDRELSRIVDGRYQGQVNRFEIMLLAALGEKYIERHSWKNHSWFISISRKRLDKMAQNGVIIGGIVDEKEANVG